MFTAGLFAKNVLHHEEHFAILFFLPTNYFSPLYTSKFLKHFLLAKFIFEILTECHKIFERRLLSWINVLFIPAMWVFVVLNYLLKTHRKICRLSLFYWFQRHWRQLREVIDTGEQFTKNLKALLNLSKIRLIKGYAMILCKSMSKRILMTLVRDWKTLKICVCVCLDGENPIGRKNPMALSLLTFWFSWLRN